MHEKRRIPRSTLFGSPTLGSWGEQKGPQSTREGKATNVGEKPTACAVLEGKRREPATQKEQLSVFTQDSIR